MKRKRIAFISMAHIEDIGSLEGKKSLFEDILVFSKLRRLERTRRLSFRFSSPSFSSVVKYRFDCGVIYIVKIVSLSDFTCLVNYGNFLEMF